MIHPSSPRPRGTSGSEWIEPVQARCTGKRRIFRGDELAQTLDAASEPWRTLVALVTVTGGRLSELLGLTWQDIDLADRDAAWVHIHRQIDRRGQFQPLKTESAERTVELPRSIVALLLGLKARSAHCRDADFIFTTRTGRPLGQRNVARALRRAQLKACDENGRPTFPRRHESGPVPKDTVPSFHGFRHHFVRHGHRGGGFCRGAVVDPGPQGLSGDQAGLHPRDQERRAARDASS